MRGRVKVLIIAGWLFPGWIVSQTLVWQDTVRLADIDSLADMGASALRMRINQSLEYMATASCMILSGSSATVPGSSMVLLHDLTYRLTGENGRRFSFSNALTHHLGLQYFFDSTCRFHVDENQLESRFDWILGVHHGCFLSSIWTTRLLNSYDRQVNEHGHDVRILQSGFLTPVTGTVSGGFRFALASFGVLSFGLTSARITWIRDRRVFTGGQTEMAFGVPVQKKGLIEYGFSLQFKAEKAWKSWFNWSCDIRLFKEMISPVDLSLQNNLSFRIGKFILPSVQTRMQYNARISRKVQLENLLSLGFRLAL